MTATSEQTNRHLRRIVLERQRTHRVPAVVGAVGRRGETLWSDSVGSADVDRPGVPPGPDDQFLIASNTKTFTAVMVMALRDEGRLRLDDPLETFIPEVGHAGITIRQMLAHVSGMQREPEGDVWETLESPGSEDLVAGFSRAERVLKPHHRWHYSNLVFAMLGQVVERLDARPWVESLHRRILDPLEMRRTTVGFTGSHVNGYYVAPYDDVPRLEPVLDLRAMVPCGGLASTVGDLLTWGGFVADPVADVLSPDTVEEMCQPQIVADLDRWELAFGLGFMLARSDGRTYVGHTGGMPGHITGVFTHRASGTTGLAMMNSTSAPDPAALSVELAAHVLVNDPEEPEPWLPGREVPLELAEVVGRWYSEGRPFVFSVREGRLEARMPDAPGDKEPSVFTQIGDDRYRTTSGRETGELLRVGRGEDGEVLKLNWATYLFTRKPLAFGE